MPVEKRRVNERRKGPDLLIKWVKWTAVIGWLFIIMIVFVVVEAKPPFETLFDRKLKIKLRDTWDMDLLRYSLYMMILLLVLCIIAFVNNLLRHKRKTDRFSVSVFLLGIASIVGIIIYLVKT
jgi:hypothetical protein